MTRAEFITVLRKPENEWLRASLGLPARIRQEDGTRDKLMLAFGALDENEDKMLSFEEFRHASLVALSSVAPPPSDSGMALGSPGGSGDMNAKL